MKEKRMYSSNHISTVKTKKKMRNVDVQSVPS